MARKFKVGDQFVLKRVFCLRKNDVYTKVNNTSGLPIIKFELGYWGTDHILQKGTTGVVKGYENVFCGSYEYDNRLTYMHPKQLDVENLPADSAVRYGSIVLHRPNKTMIVFIDGLLATVDSQMIRNLEHPSDTLTRGDSYDVTMRLSYTGLTKHEVELEVKKLKSLIDRKFNAVQSVNKSFEVMKVVKETVDVVEENEEIQSG